MQPGAGGASATYQGGMARERSPIANYFHSTIPGRWPRGWGRRPRASAGNATRHRAIQKSAPCLHRCAPKRVPLHHFRLRSVSPLIGDVPIYFYAFNTIILLRNRVWMFSTSVATWLILLASMGKSRSVVCRHAKFKCTCISYLIKRQILINNSHR